MKKFLLLFSLLIPTLSFGLVHEIASEFSYDKKIYGINRENSNVNRTYSGAFSTYIFDYTAIDLNFAYSQDTTTENTRYNVTTGIDVVGQQNRLKTYVYGIGIKQIFAPRTARLIPGISVGYAKEFINYQSDLTVEDTTNGNRATVGQGEVKTRQDSVFGTFSLQLRLTNKLSLRGSVRTLFPAFEFGKARDNLKYSAGFSWIF
jgi:hypothetical protein